MPTNSPEIRAAHPELIGHGVNLDERAEYTDKGPGVQGPKVHQLRRMGRFPETLFVRRPDTLCAWDPVCQQPDCFEPLKNWDFVVAGKRDCSAHREDFRKNKGDPKALRNPHLIRLHQEGRLVARPRRDRKSQISMYQVLCEAEGCVEFVPAYRVLRGNRALCEQHRAKYIVAGHPTRSEHLWRDREIITCWEKHPTKGCLRPMCTCTGPGCTNLVRWHRDWDEQWKANRKCSECRLKYGNLRPWEGLYRMLLASATQGGRAVEITLEQFALLCEINECHYCGTRIVRRKLKEGGKVRSSAHFLDRKDDRIDYTFENVVVCCTPCNYTRNNWISYEEMLVIGAMRSGRLERAAQLASVFTPTMEEHVARVIRNTHLRLAKWGREDRQTRQRGRRGRRVAED